MKQTFWRCGAMVAVLISGALPALGQHIGANLDTVATETFRSTTDILTSCSSRVGGGGSSGTASGSCTGGSGAPFAAIDLSSSAQGPIVSTEFARLHASAQISVDTSGPRPVPRFLEGSSVAMFQDVILFNDLPMDHAQMTFQLHGQFDAHNDFGFPASQAFADVSVRVQDGFYDPPSNAGASYEPFSEGYSSERVSFANGVTSLTTFNGATNAPDFSFTGNVTGTNDITGDFTLAVGPSFFDNPLNTGLVLQLSLGADAQVTTDWFISGASVLGASADFGNTFSMTSLAVFDAEGNDITAEAVAGFASDELPVPEPGSSAELAAGLLALAFVRKQL